MQARQHDHSARDAGAVMVHEDVQVTENFLDRHQAALFLMTVALGSTALKTEGAIDQDVGDALEALIRTYRTLATGVFYESHPENPIANRIYTAVREEAAKIPELERESLGVMRTRDADLVGVFVFLRRLEQINNNGRRKGRAFIDYLRSFAPESRGPEPPAPPSLLAP